MKITKNHLRGIIKEELNKCLNEGILDKIKSALSSKPAAKPQQASISPAKQKLLSLGFIAELTKRYPEFKRDILSRISDEDANTFADWLRGEGAATFHKQPDDWMQDWRAADRDTTSFIYKQGGVVNPGPAAKIKTASDEDELSSWGRKQALKKDIDSLKKVQADVDSGKKWVR